MQLKVICTLKHREIGNLFGVCRELRPTVSLLAIQTHLFRWQTQLARIDQSECSLPGMLPYSESLTHVHLRSISHDR